MRPARPAEPIRSQVYRKVGLAKRSLIRGHKQPDVVDVCSRKIGGERRLNTGKKNTHTQISRIVKHWHFNGIPSTRGELRTLWESWEAFYPPNLTWKPFPGACATSWLHDLIIVIFTGADEMKVIKVGPGLRARIAVTNRITSAHKRWVLMKNVLSCCCSR